MEIFLFLWLALLSWYLAWAYVALAEQRRAVARLAERLAALEAVLREVDATDGPGVLGTVQRFRDRIATALHGKAH